MPGLESLILSEKTAVIFDIGSVYTKCGFAGESGPRFIFPTQLTLPNGTVKDFVSLNTLQEKRTFLVSFLHHLYYRHLLVNPKDRRVVVVESILCTTEFRNLVANVLFEHFEVPSALFAPAHLTTLFTLGLSTGLVLDCGYREAVVIPVCEGYTLLNSWQAGQLGSEAIYRNLEDLLLENASVIDENNTLTPLKDFPGDLISVDLLEDLMVRTCFISPSSRAAEWNKWFNGKESGENETPPTTPKVAEEHFTYPLNALKGSKSLEIPSWIRELGVECLFTGDADQITIASLILRSILASPIDVRKSLAKNIILTGGTVTLPGFASRLIEELNACLEWHEFESLSALKGTFRIHRPPAEANYVAWLGGAIFGALECLPGRSLERNVYLEKRELPDWTTIIDTGLCEPAELRVEVGRT
ncbi:unnamed protein product [Calicophoron daubneyi]|uniref:Actin-related protein 10 n=1 Tax=Calicophoron daubneyi TaxID=300641 RepID=A0AAV2TAF7_CALDB